jgi:Reverse transcriptase (RNA-dependent DNA polymerase)
LDEEIYAIPDGCVQYMKDLHNRCIDPTTHVLQPKKAIYGLVQAAIQWWKKNKEVMAECNYYPSKADPCLVVKKVKDDEPMSFVIIYVDDGGINGTPEAIKEVIETLGSTVKVKSTGEMDTFVGCQIIDTPDKDGVWIHQPKLLKNLKFEEILVDTTRVFKTPSAPKTLIP